MTKQELAVIQVYTGVQALAEEDSNILYDYIADIFNEHHIKCDYDDIKFLFTECDDEEGEKSRKEILDILTRFAEKDFFKLCDMAIDLNEVADDMYGFLTDLFGDENEEEPVSDSNKHEKVDSPDHYQTKGGIEAIDVIDAFTEGLSGNNAFYTGNVLKYVMRWPKKNGLEDLEKARWYLDRLILGLLKTEE